MAAKKQKSTKKLERHFKGVANHRRIEILILVARQPELSLINITDRVQANMKTISEHVRRLVIAGLVEKTYTGREVRHRLTPYGRIFYEFIRSFSNLKQ